MPLPRNLMSIMNLRRSLSSREERRLIIIATWELIIKKFFPRYKDTLFFSTNEIFSPIYFRRVVNTVWSPLRPRSITFILLKYFFSSINIFGKEIATERILLCFEFLED